jgi:hypothetical protein
VLLSNKCKITFSVISEITLLIGDAGVNEIQEVRSMEHGADS